jgi:hypothetical protein
MVVNRAALHAAVQETSRAAERRIPSIAPHLMPEPTMYIPQSWRSTMYATATLEVVAAAEELACTPDDGVPDVGRMSQAITAYDYVRRGSIVPPSVVVHLAERAIDSLSLPGQAPSGLLLELIEFRDGKATS